MRSAQLLGRDCVNLGGLDTVAEGAAGLALSRGGAAKVYAYHDPNEDACGFAAGEGGVLLVVADGHHGHHGAKAVVEQLLGEHGPAWTSRAAPAADEAGWERAALALCVELNDLVLAEAKQRKDTPAPTTLALAILRPAEDRIFHLCVGDSHLFRCDDGEARDLGWSGQPHRDRGFLGDGPLGPELLRDRCIAGCTPLAGTRALVAVTDGLSERGIGVEDPAAVVAAAVGSSAEAAVALRPLQLARRVAERALASHRERRSGDNVAVAAAWVEALRAPGSSADPS